MSALPAELVEKARLAALLDVAQPFLSRLKRITTAEWVGPCPACGGTDRFSVNTRKARWNCRGFGGGADALSFVMHVYGLDFRGAVEHLTGESTAPAPVPPGPSTKLPDLDDEREARIKRSVARIIRELVPIKGSAGEMYLREVRAIDVNAIADVLARVDAIGWHPAVYFNAPGAAEKGEPLHPLHGQKLDAIIAIMSDPLTAAPTGAISRTYLHEGVKIGKAKTLGAPAGVVRLSLDEDVLAGLHIAEGLETALDAMARGKRPMWATGSTALMAKLPVLAGIERLTIFADRDENGAGETAAIEAVLRWREAGREATARRLKRGFGDINDLSRAER